MSERNENSDFHFRTNADYIVPSYIVYYTSMVWWMLIPAIFFMLIKCLVFLEYHNITTYPQRPLKGILMAKFKILNEVQIYQF